MINVKTGKSLVRRLRSIRIAGPANAMVIDSRLPKHRVVTLNAFTEDEAKQRFTMACRCGSQYSVTYDELEEGDGHLLLQCEGCTQRIVAAYEIAEVV